MEEAGLMTQPGNGGRKMRADPANITVNDTVRGLWLPYHGLTMQNATGRSRLPENGAVVTIKDPPDEDLPGADSFMVAT